MSEYTKEMATMDRREIDRLLRPVVDAICAERGITRADLRAGRLAAGDAVSTTPPPPPALAPPATPPHRRKPSAYCNRGGSAEADGA